MRSQFTRSFAKDLRAHRKNQELLIQVRVIIENVEQAEAITGLTNFKQLKAEGRYYRIRTGDYRIGITIEDDLVTLSGYSTAKRFTDFSPDAFRFRQ